MRVAKKVCLVGRFAVGKTSLVKRYIDNQFGEKYKTTVGVSISTKSINIEDHELSLVIWDIAGFEQDGHYNHYLRGVHGIIWVLDGTEPESFKILEVISNSLPELKSLPSVCLVNKSDLEEDWLFTEEMMDQLQQYSSSVLKCSAKSGYNVEQGFIELSRQLI